jgi:hypothetical protein
MDDPATNLARLPTQIRRKSWAYMVNVQLSSAVSRVRRSAAGCRPCGFTCKRWIKVEKSAAATATPRYDCVLMGTRWGLLPMPARSEWSGDALAVRARLPAGSDHEPARSTRRVMSANASYGLHCTRAARRAENIGAGEGNRTLVFSLEGCCSTIELHPRASDQLTRRADGLNRAYRLRACSARLSGAKPLTAADSPPILRSPPTTKGGDPVSYFKRCHLAGIAR